jgi:hypothetical protein
MLLKSMTAVLLIGIGSCVNVDAVNNGPVIQDGPVIIANVAPTIKTMETMVGTLTTTSTTIQNAIGVTIALSVEPEVGLIPQNHIVATTSTVVIVPNAFDEWDAEQKRKAGVPALEECPMDGSSCEFDEEIWLSHLPTLGELIDSYFESEDRAFITWLAYCESSGDPLDIYSDAIQPQSKATGWFQHLPKFWIERSVKAGFVGFSIDHPEANVGVASWLFYEGGGSKHWKDCTKRYLREVAINE